jgi:hypothetical protein
MCFDANTTVCRVVNDKGEEVELYSSVECKVCYVVFVS